MAVTQALNQNNLGNKVTTRTSSWLDLCMRAWGSEWNAPDHAVYEFSSGRKYDSTDKGLTGIYGVPGDDVVLLDGMRYPDMRDGLFVENGDPNGALSNGLGDYREITRNE